MKASASDDREWAWPMVGSRNKNNNSRPSRALFRPQRLSRGSTLGGWANSWPARHSLGAMGSCIWVAGELRVRVAPIWVGARGGRHGGELCTAAERGRYERARGGPCARTPPARAECCPLAAAAAVHLVGGLAKCANCRQSVSLVRRAPLRDGHRGGP